MYFYYGYVFLLLFMFCSVYSVFNVLFYILFVCKCVLYYCHWASTQLQLTNTSYHIKSYIIFQDSLPTIVLNALFVSVQILHTSVVIILQNFQNFEHHNKHLNPQRKL